LSYAEVLKGAEVGQKVAVIGAGGIGFDVSEFLLKPPHQPQPQPLQNGNVNGVLIQTLIIFLKVARNVQKLKCLFARFIYYNVKLHL
jgi:2,4-dienoyl-CoA reductase (NADPH2)